MTVGGESEEYRSGHHNGVVDAANAITRLLDGRILDTMRARDKSKDWRYNIVRSVEINALLELKELIKPSIVVGGMTDYEQER
tara:strand:- start:42324 stop:42572 length:249 start_codon:yes stop_codon:yes gene_type:complete